MLKIGNLGKRNDRGIIGIEWTFRDLLALLHDTNVATTFFSPFAASLRQPLDAAHPTGPDTFDGGSEGVSALAADDADGLENGFPAVPSEHGRMVDPF